MCAVLTGDEVLTIEAGSYGVFSMVGHLEFAKARIMDVRLEKPPGSDGDE